MCNIKETKTFYIHVNMYFNNNFKRCSYVLEEVGCTQKDLEGKEGCVEMDKILKHTHTHTEHEITREIHWVDRRENG